VWISEILQYSCVCVCVCVFVYMCICVCVYIYIYIYIYIYGPCCFLNSPQYLVSMVKVGPSPQCGTHPQVVDGGTVSDMEGSCEYIA
jgi:hypothetical protein